MLKANERAGKGSRHPHLLQVDARCSCVQHGGGVAGAAVEKKGAQGAKMGVSVQRLGGAAKYGN